MFCFESKHAALKGSSVKYVNPTHSILRPVLCEKNAFVLAIQDQLQRDYSTNPRQHLRVQSAQEAATFKLDSITFGS